MLGFNHSAAVSSRICFGTELSDKMTLNIRTPNNQKNKRTHTLWIFKIARIKMAHFSSMIYDEMIWFALKYMYIYMYVYIYMCVLYIYIYVLYIYTRDICIIYIYVLYIYMYYIIYMYVYIYILLYILLYTLLYILLYIYYHIYYYIYTAMFQFAHSQTVQQPAASWASQTNPGRSPKRPIPPAVWRYHQEKLGHVRWNGE